MMGARTKNPMIISRVLPALLDFGAIAEKAGVPKRTIDLVHLRVSQIHECGVCADMHARELREAGETDERVGAVAAWRDSAYFSDAERAALALAESRAHTIDGEEPVPDDVWDEAARHYDETGLAALSLMLE
jgi:AhpD family alkylhydroperoxidase